jgi:hypothetical protein
VEGLLIKPLLLSLPSSKIVTILLSDFLGL